MSISVIILAAGQGKRTGLDYNKMFYEIDGVSVIEKSVKSFYEHKEIDEIIIVVNENEEEQMSLLLFKYNPIYVIGGKERFNSVFNGLNKVTNTHVLIHDGARCFLDTTLITKISDATIKYSAACLGVVSKDTIHICENGYIIQTPNRKNTYLAQTPQGFKTSIILDAYNKMINNSDNNITDDVMVIRKYSNYKVKIIESEYSNIKITTPEDL